MSGWCPRPAWVWVAGFAACMAADAALHRWVLLPVFVMGFYGGVVIVELVTYPLLGWWRARLAPHGLRTWYLVGFGGLWAGPAVVLASLSPWWLGWRWVEVLPLQVTGALMLIPLVGVGAWAMGSMGWARLLLAPALFPPGAEAENGVPRRLVVEGPYRYARHPLYGTDLGVILSAALLTSNQALVILAGIYLVTLGMQIYLEERELEVRFGEVYTRYRRAVPRFVPRLRPVNQDEIHDARSKRRRG